jgi:hypothetical protein
MKKGWIAGMVLLGLLALLMPAQACLVEDEPGRGHGIDARKADRHWSASHRWYSPEPDPPAFARRHYASDSRWDRDDDDRGFDRRSRHFDRYDRSFRDFHDGSFFGWFPTMLFGGKWADLFKDLPKWEDYFDKDPAFVLFGGFMRHMFVGFIFPLDSNGQVVDPPPPQNPTPTPVPAAVLLLGTGLAGLGLVRMRLNRARG